MGNWALYKILLSIFLGTLLLVQVFSIGSLQNLTFEKGDFNSAYAARAPTTRPTIQPDSYEGKEIQKAADVMRGMGFDSEADNILQFLNGGKIKLDKRADKETRGYNDVFKGPIFLSPQMFYPERLRDGKGTDPASARDQHFLVDLALTIIHEKFHSEFQSWWRKDGGVKIDEVEAYSEEIRVLDLFIVRLNQQCNSLLKDPNATSDAKEDCLDKLNNVLSLKKERFRTLEKVTGVSAPASLITEINTLETNVINKIDLFHEDRRQQTSSAGNLDDVDSKLATLETNINSFFDGQLTPVPPFTTQLSIASSVTFDDAGHQPFTGDPPEKITMQIQSITFTGDPPWVTVSGTLAPDDTFTTSGTGTVAGFPDIAATFDGDLSNANTIIGILTWGANGGLPGGFPIIWSIGGGIIDDIDGDGILNTLDTDDFNISSDFVDKLFPATAGSITNFGDQAIRLGDIGGPRVSFSSICVFGNCGVDSIPFTGNACNGSIQWQAGPSDTDWELSCGFQNFDNPHRIYATEGVLAVTLNTDAPTSATTNLGVDQGLRFDPSTGNLFSFDTNSVGVTISISGSNFVLAPGDGLNIDSSTLLPDPPTVNNPLEGGLVVGNVVTFGGTAAPNTTVKVSLFDQGGDLQATQSTLSDSTGKWQTTFGSVFGLKDGVHKAEVVSIVGNPLESKPTQLRFAIDTTPCLIPASGNWIIETDCILENSAVAPANVVVQAPSLLTIPSGVTLEIDFSQFNLTIEFGSGVRIKAGGTISSPAGGLG